MLFIEGRLQPAESGSTMPVFNPATGALMEEVPRAGESDVALAVAAARRAFDQGPWPRLSGKSRGDFLAALAAGLKKRMVKFMRLEMTNGGALKQKAMDDVLLSIKCLQYYADFARHFETSRPIEALNAGGKSDHQVVYEPMGVCAAVIPWNFPLKFAIWKLAPALATGNTVVLKPSELTPLVTDLLAEVLMEVGLPEGVVNFVPGLGHEAGAALVTDPRIDKIAFTGSTATGRAIMAAAAANLTPVTLECGGKSAHVILEDADLETSVSAVLYAAFYHAGQCCEAGTRLILPDTLHDRFLEQLVGETRKLQVGDPADGKSRIGPIISKKQYDRVLDYIEKGRAEGARLECGGAVPDRESGWYVAPTIFSDVEPGMRIAQEEIFGPVLSVMRYKNESEIARLVNSTSYGLAAGIRTGDPARARSLAADFKVGTVWINDWHDIHEEAPFGGYKQSGIGREFGQEGPQTYLQSKHIQTTHKPDPRKKI